MKAILDFLMPLMHSRAGVLVQWAVGALIGLITTGLMSLGIELTPEDWAGLARFLSAVCAALVNLAMGFYTGWRNKQLQVAIGAKPDTWIGDETIAQAQAVRALADQAVTKLRR